MCVHLGAMADGEEHGPIHRISVAVEDHGHVELLVDFSVNDPTPQDPHDEGRALFLVASLFLC